MDTNLFIADAPVPSVGQNRAVSTADADSFTVQFDVLIQQQNQSCSWPVAAGKSAPANPVGPLFQAINLQSPVAGTEAHSVTDSVSDERRPKSSQDVPDDATLSAMNGPLAQVLSLMAMPANNDMPRQSLATLTIAAGNGLPVSRLNDLIGKSVNSVVANMLTFEQAKQTQQYALNGMLAQGVADQGGAISWSDIMAKGASNEEIASAGDQGQVDLGEVRLEALMADKPDPALVSAQAILQHAAVSAGFSIRVPMATPLTPQLKLAAILQAERLTTFTAYSTIADSNWSGDNRDTAALQSPLSMNLDSPKALLSAAAEQSLDSADELQNTGFSISSVEREGVVSRALGFTDFPLQLTGAGDDHMSFASTVTSTRSLGQVLSSWPLSANASAIRMLSINVSGKNAAASLSDKLTSRDMPDALLPATPLLSAALLSGLNSSHTVASEEGADSVNATNTLSNSGAEALLTKTASGLFDTPGSIITQSALTDPAAIETTPPGIVDNIQTINGYDKGGAVLSAKELPSAAVSKPESVSTPERTPRSVDEALVNQTGRAALAASLNDMTLADRIPGPSQSIKNFIDPIVTAEQIPTVANGSDRNHADFGAVSKPANVSATAVTSWTVDKSGPVSNTASTVIPSFANDNLTAMDHDVSHQHKLEVFTDRISRLIEAGRSNVAPSNKTSSLSDKSAAAISTGDRTAAKSLANMTVMATTAAATEHVVADLPVVAGIQNKLTMVSASVMTPVLTPSALTNQVLTPQVLTKQGVTERVLSGDAINDHQSVPVTDFYNRVVAKSGMTSTVSADAKLLADELLINKNVSTAIEDVMVATGKPVDFGAGGARLTLPNNALSGYRVSSDLATSLISADSTQEMSSPSAVNESDGVGNFQGSNAVPLSASSAPTLQPDNQVNENKLISMNNAAESLKAKVLLSTVSDTAIRNVSSPVDVTPTTDVPQWADKLKGNWQVEGRSSSLPVAESEQTISSDAKPISNVFIGEKLRNANTQTLHNQSAQTDDLSASMRTQTGEQVGSSPHSEPIATVSSSAPVIAAIDLQSQPVPVPDDGSDVVARKTQVSAAPNVTVQQVPVPGHDLSMSATDPRDFMLMQNNDVADMTGLDTHSAVNNSGSINLIAADEPGVASHPLTLTPFAHAESIDFVSTKQDRIQMALPASMSISTAQPYVVMNNVMNKAENNANEINGLSNAVPLSKVGSLPPDEIKTTSAVTGNSGDKAVLPTVASGNPSVPESIIASEPVAIHADHPAGSQPLSNKVTLGAPVLAGDPVALLRNADNDGPHATLSTNMPVSESPSANQQSDLMHSSSRPFAAGTSAVTTAVDFNAEVKGRASLPAANKTTSDVETITKPDKLEPAKGADGLPVAMATPRVGRAPVINTPEAIIDAPAPTTANDLPIATTVKSNELPVELQARTLSTTQPGDREAVAGKDKRGESDRQVSAANKSFANVNAVTPKADWRDDVLTVPGQVVADTAEPAVISAAVAIAAAIHDGLAMAPEQSVVVEKMKTNTVAQDPDNVMAKPTQSIIGLDLPHTASVSDNDSLVAVSPGEPQRESAQAAPSSVHVNAEGRSQNVLDRLLSDRVPDLTGNRIELAATDSGKSDFSGISEDSDNIALVQNQFANTGVALHHAVSTRGLAESRNLPTPQAGNDGSRMNVAAAVSSINANTTSILAANTSVDPASLIVPAQSTWLNSARMPSSAGKAPRKEASFTAEQTEPLATVNKSASARTEAITTKTGRFTAVTKNARTAESSVREMATTITRQAADTIPSALRLPLMSPRFHDLLSNQVLWFANHGLSSAEIHLDPADLGPIDVKIYQNGHETSLQFTVSQPQTREQLEQALPRLREVLHAGGMQLLQVDVQDGRRQAPQRDIPQEAARPNAPVLVETEVELTAAKPRTKLIADGRVDAYA